MTPRAPHSYPPLTRTVCDEAQAFAFFRTHGRGGAVEFASPALGARLASAIVRLAARELDAQSAALQVVSSGVVRTIARLAPDAGFPVPVPIGAAEPLANTLCAEVVAKGTVIAIEDGYRGPASSPMRGASAMLGIPVGGAQREIAGVLWVGDRRPRRWTAEEIGRLRVLAGELGGGVPADAGVREASRSWKAELLHMLMVDSPMGLYAVDERDGSVLMHNRCFLEIFAMDELASRFDGCDISHPAVLSRVLTRTMRPMALRRVLTRISDPAVRRAIDSEIDLADGRRIHCWSAQIRDETDGYLGRCYLIEDVTARRSLEERLAQAQKMEAIGHFAGGVAHDFNNVLAIILSTAEVSLAGTAPSTQAWKDLDTIRAAARYGGTLTNRLLAYARHLPAARTPVDVGAIVSETAPLIERLLPRNITLHLANHVEGHRILTDRGELQQVLLNLTANARDALPHGGDIVVETHAVVVPRDARPARVPDGEYVRVSVTDTGVGITAEARERMFEPLFTTKSAGRGTGLGLATVYGIVTNARGHIVVESVPGNTRFDVYMPVAGG